MAITEALQQNNTGGKKLEIIRGQLELSIKKIKNSYEDIFVERKFSIPLLNILLELEYLSNQLNALICANQSCITMYQGSKPFFLNPSFLDTMDCHDEKPFIEGTKQITLHNYRGEHLEKVIHYVKELNDIDVGPGEIACYKNIPFTMEPKDSDPKTLLWSNYKIGGTNDIFVRFGCYPRNLEAIRERFYKAMEPGILVQNDKQFISKSDIKTFKEQVSDIESRMITLFEVRAGSPTSAAYLSLKETLVQYKLLAMAADLYIAEGPNPVTFYKGDTKDGLPLKKPVMLNPAFQDISGYPMNDVLTHYKEHGEITSMFYASEDLQNVTTQTTNLEGQLTTVIPGYINEPFTLTRPDEDKVTNLFNNTVVLHLYEIPGYRSSRIITDRISLRTGIVDKIYKKEDLENS
ncbi:MAG: hypothetical protein PHS92_01935 [Candidatus Gracilibacteria bacterium]|nr:hypothetical protein [Candidatus Gracilibacteria bacterium]